MIHGRLAGGTSSHSIHWHAAGFLTPFEFPTDVIRSIKFPPVEQPRGDQPPFTFELNSGDVVAGRLAGWSDQAVTIHTVQIGNQWFQKMSKSNSKTHYSAQSFSYLVFEVLLKTQGVRIFFP
jgi:hypothetical protein